MHCHRGHHGPTVAGASGLRQRVNPPSSVLAILDNRVIGPDPADTEHRDRRRELCLLDQLHRPDPTHAKNLRQLCQRPTSADFASDEPPLIRGGNESVYEVRSITGFGASWRQAARFAVEGACGRFDDARVGEVRALRCNLDHDGAVRFTAELAVSVKHRAPDVIQNRIQSLDQNLVQQGASQ